MLSGARSVLVELGLAVGLDRQARAVERLRFEKVNRLVDCAGRLQVVNRAAVGTLGRLQRRVLQVQVQILYLVRAPVAAASSTASADQELVRTLNQAVHLTWTHQVVLVSLSKTHSHYRAKSFEGLIEFPSPKKMRPIL